MTLRAGWIVAALVVAAANLAAFAPALIERRSATGRVEMVACSWHLAGGYGERDRIRLSLQPELYGELDGLSPATLAAIGFDDTDIARLGEPMPEAGLESLPGVRAAWVRLEQRDDSMHAWRAVSIGANRDAVGGPGLIVRGRVGLAHESRDSSAPRLVAQLYGVVPATLHLDDAQGAALRRLRTGSDRCINNASVMLGNGSSGAVWVESVR